MPNDFPVALKHNALVDIVGKLQIPFFMLFFDFCDHLEKGGNLHKAFLFGGLCKPRIHVGPFVIFACRGVLQIGKSVSDLSAFLQEFEPNLSVFFFVVCGFFKEIRYLVVAIFFRL